MQKQEKLNKLRTAERVNILAIETSCDETAAAVVCNGRKVLSNVLYSQIEIHKQYGGVVPEIASRNHVEKLPYIVRGALEEAGLSWDQIDALAVTSGPGLVGALLTGVSYAKALAYALGKPLVAVNHMEGHISANYITHMQLEPPFICLIASGGHTNIVKVTDYCNYEVLGSTRDDAAGEAFDKVARVLGLTYPGGPNVQRLAEQGDPDCYVFTKPFHGESHLDFSFSGIKTAVINLVRGFEVRGQEYRKADVAASFQKAAVSLLIENVFEAARRTGIKKVVLGGGVSANSALRAQALQQKNYQVYLPDLRYCTDNGAMIASAAYYSIIKGCAEADLTLNAKPGMELI
jgi:N6-L-threonylcarbamoyladenine synthase